MKTLIICITLCLWGGNFYAQEIIELPETRLELNTVNTAYFDGNSLTYAIKDTFKGEFEKDPIAFVKNRFDIQEVISQVNKEDFDGYDVSFRSRKGVLNVKFDDEGKIVHTIQRFKNTVLPADIRHNLYRDYKGWAMVSNSHFARGKNDKIDKQVYRIKLEKGNKKKTIKIRPDSLDGSEVASN